MVADISSVMSSCLAVHSYGTVDLLKRPAVDIEFAIEDNVAVQVGEFFGDMLNDFGREEVTVAGLHLAIAVECTDAVEFRLNEVRKVELVLVIVLFLSEHWFHFLLWR